MANAKTLRFFENRCDKLIKKFQKGHTMKDGETVVVNFHFLDGPNVLKIEKGDSVPTRSWLVEGRIMGRKQLIQFPASGTEGKISTTGCSDFRKALV